jgi:hypothetical protein
VGSAIEAGTSVSLPEPRRQNQADVRLRAAFGPARETLHRRQHARHQLALSPRLPRMLHELPRWHRQLGGPCRACAQAWV